MTSARPERNASGSERSRARRRNSSIASVRARAAAPARRGSPHRDRGRRARARHRDRDDHECCPRPGSHGPQGSRDTQRRALLGSWPLPPGCRRRRAGGTHRAGRSAQGEAARARGGPHVAPLTWWSRSRPPTWTIGSAGDVGCGRAEQGYAQCRRAHPRWRSHAHPGPPVVSSASRSREEAPQRSTRRTTAALVVAAVAFAVQQTAVVPAVHDVEVSLHSSHEWASWLVTVYLMVATVGTPAMAGSGTCTGVV